MKKYFLGFLFLALIIPAFAENVTLTTYYPAPSGAYKAMRSHGLCVGTACTHALISDNNLSVQGNIGIGTTVPAARLSILGVLPSIGLAITTNPSSVASMYIALDPRSLDNPSWEALFITGPGHRWCKVRCRPWRCRLRS